MTESDGDPEGADAAPGQANDKLPAAAIPQLASCLPNALERLEALVSTCHHPAFFLDYDRTLAPIVANPELAIISSECREAIRALSDAYPVSVVSGRSVDKLKKFLKVDVVLAGSHGLDIQGTQLQGRDKQSSAVARSAGDRIPAKSAAAGAKMDPPACAAAGKDDEGRLVHPVAAAGRGLLSQARAKLDEALGGTVGYETEDNEFCISVHYRRVPAEHHEQVHAAVRRVVSELEGLMLRHGKMVHELRPDVPWDKGRAVEYLLSRLPAPPPDAACTAEAQDNGAGISELNAGPPRLCPFYLGDDVADEDALAFVESVGGVGIKARGFLLHVPAPPAAASPWVLPAPTTIRCMQHARTAHARAHARTSTRTPIPPAPPPDVSKGGQRT
jgi:trehalose-phosphatase